MTLVLLQLALVYAFANTTDVLLIGLFALFRNGNAFLQALDLHGKKVLVVIGVFSSFVALYNCISKALPKRTTQNASNQDVEIQPSFIPCETTHTRLFPKKHSFSYSYLLTGLQVGWKGSVGDVLSVETENHEDAPKKVAKDWFVIDAGDYLERGYGQLGLKGKLHLYLRSQNVDPAEYPYAYLVTVPKLLGYSFNPVSFWYLYSAEKDLTAMVLEVNNTFGERRPYFMKIAEKDLEKSSSLNSDGISSKPTRFTNTWNKDFHVSPFNSRKGAYSVVAYDPLFPKMAGRGSIDNTITLLSSKSHAKLIARVFSKGDPVDPAKMGFISRMEFLSSWWWVIWATAIRTIKQAVTLYFTHELHVWFRPEPLLDTFGRIADETEDQLEVIFRKYLVQLVENSKTPLHVTYTAAGIPISKSTAKFSSPSADAQSKELDFKVLTPLFYTRFISYASECEAFSTESSEYGTLHLSDPSLLQSLLSTNNRPPQTPSSQSILGTIFFQIIKKIGRSPEILGISQPSKPNTGDPPTSRSTPSKNKQDIKNLTALSGIDIFVLTKASNEDRNRYIAIALKLTISERLTVGGLDVLSLGLFFGRITSAWLIARSLNEWLTGVLTGYQ